MVSIDNIKEKFKAKQEEKFTERYLVCDNCGGYYQLQEGESPDDFTSCECGGKLTYSQKTEYIDENFIECPNCGVEQNKGASFCKKCGNSLTKKNINTHSKGKQKIVLIIAIVILIGVVIALSWYIIDQNQQLTNATNNTSIKNNTTAKKITTSPTTTVKETTYIGKAAAKKVAIDFLTDRGGMETIEIRSVDFLTINGIPLYRVKYWDHYITYDGTEYGWGEVYIGAKDGKLYDEEGYLVTT